MRFMPKVVVTGPDKVSREFELTRELTLGRHASNEIQINEEKASRRHCRFRPVNGAVVVEDLDSSNGTKINGRKISQQALKHGDVILIGQHSIAFVDEANRFDRTVVLPEISDADVARAKAAQTSKDRPTAARIPAAVKMQQEERTEMDVHIKPLDEEKWNAERAPKAHEHDPRVIARYVAYGIAGIVVLVIALRFRPTSRPQDDARPIAPVAVAPQNDPPTPVETETPVPVETAATPPIPTPPDIPAVTVKPPVIPAKDPSILPPPRIPAKKPVVSGPATDFGAELTQVLAERDRALLSGNYAGARAALNQFIAACSDKAVAERAQKELKSTDQVIDTALEAQLTEARQAAAKSKYRLATQTCTRLMAQDLQGRFGSEARAILTRIDETAAPRFKDIDTKADAAIRAGHLERAGQLLEAGLDGLGGTRWAELVSTQQLQVLMARGLVRKLEGAREKLAASGKAPTVTLPSRKVNGTLLKVSGAGVDLRAGGVALSIAFKDMSPVDFEAIQKVLGVGGEMALEEAYFWQLHDRVPLAQVALERALQKPEQAGPERAALAVRLVSLLPGQQNLRLYDFSKWQHQSDWDALSGSWSTANDRYVLESPEGGDTALRVSESAALTARNLRVSFDFELLQPADGAYCAFEFGSEQKAVSLIFAQDSVTLHANLDGPLSQKQPWKLVPAHVDVVVHGESVDVTVNGEKLPSLAVPGISELKGTVLFRVREAAAAFDNVVLRNASGQ